MSAFIVDNAHINAILNASAPRFAGDGATYRWQGKVHYFGGDSQRIGQVLTDENYRSVNYRYQEQTEPRRFQRVMLKGKALSPIEIVKLCHSYSYQSCEAPDWKETEAHAIVGALRERSIRQIEGYEEAPWTLYDDQSVATVVTGTLLASPPCASPPMPRGAQGW